MRAKYDDAPGLDLINHILNYPIRVFLEAIVFVHISTNDAVPLCMNSGNIIHIEAEPGKPKQFTC